MGLRNDAWGAIWMRQCSRRRHGVKRGRITSNVRTQSDSCGGGVSIELPHPSEILNIIHIINFIIYFNYLILSAIDLLTCSADSLTDSPPAPTD